VIFIIIWSILNKLQAEFDFIELSPECIRQHLIGFGASDTKHMSRQRHPGLEMKVIQFNSVLNILSIHFVGNKIQLKHFV